MNFSNVYRPNFLEIFGEMLKHNFLYLHELYSLGMVNKAICIGSFYNEKLLRFLLSFNYNQDNPNCPRGIATRICPWHANLGTFEEKNNTVYYRWVKTPKTPQDLHLIIQDQTKKLKQKHNIPSHWISCHEKRLEQLKYKELQLKIYMEERIKQIRNDYLYDVKNCRAYQKDEEKELTLLNSQLPFTVSIWDSSYEQKAHQLLKHIHQKALKLGPTFRGHKGLMKKLRILSKKYPNHHNDRFPVAGPQKTDVATFWNTLPLKRETKEQFIERIRTLNSQIIDLTQ